MNEIAASSPALPKVVSRVAGTISTGQAVWEIAKSARRRWVERSEYITTISSRDDSYQIVMRAVLARMESTNRRAVELITGNSSGMAVPDDGRPSRTPITWMYDGSRTVQLPLDGHLIRVSLTESRTEKFGDFELMRRSIQFTSPTIEARDALHTWLETIIAENREVAPAMRIATRWGSWSHRGDVPQRAMDTVILAGDQKERVIADLSRFLRAESDYARLGTSWHRGYLFYGSPGTGKTSFARALASHFSMNIYYMPLGDMPGDVNLISLVSDVPPRSIVLLEDVDVYAAARKREDDTPGTASLSGALNALDGIFTPHGIIKILTTNRRDALDDALIRAGRIDLEVEFDLTTSDQVARLWKLAFPGEYVPTDVRRLVGLQPAQITGVLQENIDDPEAALIALKELTI